MNYQPPIALIILDGFGYRADHYGNAIACASMPIVDYLIHHYPSTLLKASGKHVGLMPNVPGNSEVGHQTIGAGRSIKSTLVRFQESIDNNTLANNPILHDNLMKVATTSNRLHIMGLLSDGNVHSNDQHLYALIKIATAHSLKEIFIHAFLDGRDVPPQSAQQSLEYFEQQTNHLPNVTLASLHGRFYAMDRDHNLDRTNICYNTLIGKQPSTDACWRSLLDQWFINNTSEEFFPPTLLYKEGIVRNGDGIIFFNTRADRMRQLASLFIHPTPTNPHRLFVISPILYDQQAPNPVLFKQEKINNTLLDVIAQELPAPYNKVFITAETEKFAHVTYFFNGNRNHPLSNETWHLVPSLKEKNYINHPTMSAALITQAVRSSLLNNPAQFYLINYANADMVGHSGNFHATVAACECLDQQIGHLYKAFVQERNGTLIITADHGKAEEMLTRDGTVRTAHTANPVPLLIVSNTLFKTEQPPLHVATHDLQSIAGLISQVLKIPIPNEWNRDLISFFL